MSRRIDVEWWAVLAGVAVAGAGWVLGSTLLAIAGMLGAVAALALWVWQRECLTGVSYRRALTQRRAAFGEEVGLEVEFVNDKLLPLTWLHVQDDVPRTLEIRGGVRSIDRSSPGELHHLLPMAPFQRVRRRFTIVCQQRGEHTFGPARLRSGDPIGLHERSARLAECEQLLVYPKVFRLAGLPIISRVPLGEERTRARLVGDPSRTVGVREYRVGDPLRHIDWRATARGGGLLVREFEPTATLSVAVFIDMRLPRLSTSEASRDALEFTIALGASVIADLAGRGVATGLYASGAVDGYPIVREPSSSPASLPAMLELLARAAPRGPASIDEIILSEGSRLSRNATVVVIAADFDGPTCLALAGSCRRTPVVALWVSTERSRGSASERMHPPPALAEASREVSYDAGWRHQEILDILL